MFVSRRVFCSSDDYWIMNEENEMCDDDDELNSVCGENQSTDYQLVVDCVSRRTTDDLNDDILCVM